MHFADGFWHFVHRNVIKYGLLGDAAVAADGADDVFQVHTVDVCAAQSDVNVCVNSISLSVVVPPVGRTSTMSSTSRSQLH